MTRTSHTAARLFAILVAMSASAHAQDIDLLCGPYMVPSYNNAYIREPAAGSVAESNLPIHIHLGDKPELRLWDGTRPDRVWATGTAINFDWDAKHADGQTQHGVIDRQTGAFLMWVYDHSVRAKCLPVERLF